jgi:murein DD-endopeptidase MepM/ murein hydrolase activator NlpD
MESFVKFWTKSILVFCSIFCNQAKVENQATLSNIELGKRLLKTHPQYQAQGFSFPVGKNGSAKGYYVAQGFGVKNKRFGGNRHLGEDWNGNGGGNTDFGDPVLAIADGFVVFTGYGGMGWGDVIRIIHYYKEKDKVIILESVYGHVSQMDVTEGTFVRKSEKIGEIGDAGGLYPAHLHLELRSDPDLELGGGYGSETAGFLDPRKFILKHSVRKKLKK